MKQDRTFHQKAGYIVQQDWISIVTIAAATLTTVAMIVLAIGLLNGIPNLTFAGAVCFIASTALWIGLVVAMTVQIATIMVMTILRKLRHK